MKADGRPSRGLAGGEVERCRRGAGGNRLFLGGIGLVLPASRTKNRVLSMFRGVEIERSAYIGHTLLIRTESIRLAAGARIGHLNLVRGLKELRLDSTSSLGSLNTVSSGGAYSKWPDDGRRARLVLAAESVVTNRHYLDCSGGISIGTFTVLAGCRTTVLTHEIDLDHNRPILRPVTIGARCFLGSNLSVVSGTTIADNIVVAMGAVTKGLLGEAGQLYAGVPARPMGAAHNKMYVERRYGHVTVPNDPSMDQPT